MIESTQRRMLCAALQSRLAQVPHWEQWTTAASATLSVYLLGGTPYVRSRLGCVISVAHGTDA